MIKRLLILILLMLTLAILPACGQKAVPAAAPSSTAQEVLESTAPSSSGGTSPNSSDSTTTNSSDSTTTKSSDSTTPNPPDSTNAAETTGDLTEALSPDGHYSTIGRIDSDKGIYEVALKDQKENKVLRTYEVVGRDYGFLWAPDGKKVSVTY
ncbi:MAG: hypothetical protein N2376_12375, partial [Clostridia bacterium]|nr:hypothetical protein [Clostridia bacterium]